jgi:hypothetical protein
VTLFGEVMVCVSFCFHGHPVSPCF